MKRFCVILSLSCFFLYTGIAAPPTFTAIWPPGARRGSEVDIELVGKFDPWPCKLHFSIPGLVFTPDPEKAGKGKLKLPTNAPIGPLLVRTWNEEGASPPRIFIIDDRFELQEEEKDGSTLAKAQQIDLSTLPLVINGQLAGNYELDSFRFDLKQNEQIAAAVEGYSLRSPIDPVLHLYDDRGNRLLLEHDSAKNLDPVLTFRAPTAGTYILSIAGFAHPPATSVYYRGAKGTHYRLHLAREKSSIPIRLLPRVLGKDTQSDTIQSGQPITGTLAKNGEGDRYKFEAKKGDQFLVRVEAASLGYPTDPVLAITTAEGKSISTSDDTKRDRDSEYFWKVAADGAYEISVADRFRRGDDNMRYRLSVDPPSPSFSADVAKSEFVLEPGKPLEIKVSLKRLYGHSKPLTASIPNLPKGVELTLPDKFPERDGDITLKLQSAETATPFSQPFSIEIREEGEHLQTILANCTFHDKDSRGPFAIDGTTELWLTLPPQKQDKKEEAEKK